MKKILSIIIAAVICFSTMYIGSYQAVGLEFRTACGTFYYTEGETTVTLTGYDGRSDKVTVPSAINGKTVTEISSNTFDGENSIKQLFINDSIKTIAENAVLNCSNLTYVYVATDCEVAVPQFTRCRALKQIACKYNSPLWQSQRNQRLMISVPTDTGYTGKKITPGIVVSDKGRNLTLNRDYTVTATNNKNPGKAEAQVTFKGKYRDNSKKVLSYYIKPAKTRVTAISYNYSELTAVWDKVKGASGYEVYFSTDKNFKTNVHKKKLTGSGSTSVTITLPTEWIDDDLFYVKVRSYKETDSKICRSGFAMDRTKLYEQADEYEPLNYEVMKGIWVSYIDLEVTGNDYSYATFKRKFNSIVSKSKSQGYNTLIVQVRPFNDALYYSEYFPYSHVISGKQGKSDFDALDYMIQKAHAEKMSIHAWINPYRVRLRSSNFTLSSDNPYMQKPSMGVQWDGGIYLNPADRDARALIVKGVAELVAEYDIDGIQFDDYFYPTTSKYFDMNSYNAYKSSAKSPKSLSKWRNSNVNKMVKEVHTTVKNLNEGVLFGISPQGNYNNNAQLYADVKTWCTKEGYIDYICPQVYWSLTNPTLTFDNAMKRWMNLDFHDELKLYVGLAGYKAGSASEDFGTWGRSNTIMKQEFQKAMNDYFADGIMVFRYGNMSSRQSKAEYSNLSKAMKKYV